MRRIAPVLGVRVKSGWAAIVLLDGTRSAPLVIDTRRLELSDPATPASKQPHHAKAGTPQTDVRVLRRLIALVERCARTNVAAVLEEYRAAGWKPARAAVVGTSNTDPATITNPHIQIHALEGRLFRRVAVAACAAARLRTREVLERELISGAPETLGCSWARVGQRLAKLRPAGVGPWRQEQKLAALAAWLELPEAVGRAPNDRPR